VSGYIDSESGVEHMSEQAYEEWRRDFGSDPCDNCGDEDHTEGMCPNCPVCGGDGGQWQTIDGEKQWAECGHCGGQGNAEVTDPIPGRSR
jgi:hypothetical protein